jgi:TonB family protein
MKMTRRKVAHARPVAIKFLFMHLSLLMLLLLSAGPCARASAAVARARQPPAQAAAERERGVELYKRGEMQGAVKALRAAVRLDKTDADAWYYLSLALNRGGEHKEARKALENSVKLRPNFAPARAGLAYLLVLSNKLREALREAESALALDARNAEASYVVSVVRLRQGEAAKALDAIEAALKYKPDFGPALLWKSQVLLSSYAERTDYVENESAEARAARTKGATDLLKQAAESLEKYFQLNPSPPNAEVWREQLATLRVYVQNAKQGELGSERTAFTPGQVTTKARILYRPEPQYTQEASKNQVSGVVILRAVLSADGTVQNILVIHSLPHGLTELAVKAARNIKFIPATKDGRPVSQFLQIEYNFSFY